MIPFEVRELEVADGAAADLFQRSFHVPPPGSPRHFVARLARSHREAVHGYVHFSVFEPQVFLCGGLCVDVSVYRILASRERKALAGEGSLSRWLLERSIEALGSKRAVFAFTGDTRSRRDCAAIGFTPTSSPFLIVQWHGEPHGARAELVRRVAALGPF